MLSSRVIFPTEADLADLKRGDAGAFQRLVSRFGGPILNFVRIHLGDEHAAEDVTQEVLATVSRQMGAYRRDGSFSGWLFQIARNAARNSHRGRRRSADLEARWRPVAQVPDPAAELERRELRQRIRTALERLEPEEQEVLVLCDMNGLSYREAAEGIGISEKAFSVRLVRARNRLKEAVKAL